MDYISSAILSGLIYNAFQVGGSFYIDCAKEALKSTILTQEEQTIIALELKSSTEEERSSKENLEKFFNTKAEETSKILTKYKGENILIHNGTGDIRQNNVTGGYVENQTINNVAQKEENLKKY